VFPLPSVLAEIIILVIIVLLGNDFWVNQGSQPKPHENTEFHFTAWFEQIVCYMLVVYFVVQLWCCNITKGSSEDNGNKCHG
jgi:hypothetical protein